MLLKAILWIREHQDEFMGALAQHLIMSGVALTAALAISLPFAVLILNHRRLAAPVINVVNGLRTVPSLGILAITMPLLGIGMLPAIVALTVLAMPPILINAYTGLRDADADAVDAAIGMGMYRREVLWKIRIPLAAPAVFSGGRTAAIQVLAGATLAPFIGGGGLGDFILAGITMMDMSKLLVGAMPIAILALATEFTLSRVEKLLFSTGDLT